MNMKSFKIGYQLQRAALIHMARTNIEKKEKDRLKRERDAELEKQRKADEEAKRIEEA